MRPTCCSLRVEDRHMRTLSAGCMNKESQIDGPTVGPFATPDSEKHGEIRQARLSQTGERFVFQSDLCLDQTADCVV